MPDLTIAVATNGDVPDNQCALKDAVLVAAATGMTDPTAIVALARDFYAFLVAPAGTAAANAATQAPAPAPEALGAAPLVNGLPADTAPSGATPEPVAAPADAAPADAAPAADAPAVSPDPAPADATPNPA